MDFSTQFISQFAADNSYYETEIDLSKKLQDTRHALQESLSENDQLLEIIAQMYHEARIENVATSELLEEAGGSVYRNLALPRNADSLSTSEKAGYTLMYMKFLGFSTRKLTEEYHKTKDHLEGMHKSIRGNTTEIEVKRTGVLKIPELDGQREIKRNSKPETPVTPPHTPPKVNDETLSILEDRRTKTKSVKDKKDQK